MQENKKGQRLNRDTGKVRKTRIDKKPCLIHFDSAPLNDTNHSISHNIDACKGRSRQKVV